MMRKKVVGGLLLLAGVCSCNSGRKSAVTASDSLLVQEEVDVMGFLEERQLVPTDVDDLFDDFMYLFSTDNEFQRSRVSFPICCATGDGDSLWIDEEKWEHDNLLMGKPYYTLLYDRESDLDAVSDTLQTVAWVEWYDLTEREMKSYRFDKTDGKWLLSSISLQSLDGLPEKDFIDFFFRFASDSTFQTRHVITPLEFVTADPDDDFAILTTTLDLNQWLAFRPILPVNMLSNIRFSERSMSKTRTKILSIKGNGNGISCTLFFRRKNDRNWELYKYEDVSI